MYQYVAESNKCVRKLVLPKWVDADSAVASYGERVVIVGGSNRTEGDMRALLLNMTGDGSETQLPDLPKARCYAAVVLSDNDVYVIGGQNKHTCYLSSVYHLSLGKAAWQEKKSMPLAVHSSLVVRHQQYIYVLGGHSGIIGSQDAAFRYHIQNDTLERCLLPKDYMSIYAVNGHQDSALRNLRYHIQDDKWKQCWFPEHYMFISNTVAGVVVHGDKIKVFTVNKCVTYNVSNDTWFVTAYYPQNNKAIGKKVNAFVSQGQIRGTVWGGDYENHNMMSYDEQNEKWIIQNRWFTSGWHTKLFC